MRKAMLGTEVFFFQGVRKNFKGMKSKAANICATEDGKVMGEK